MKIFLDLFDFTLSFKFYSNIVLYALGLVSSSLFSITTTAGDTTTKHITPALFDIFIWNNPPNACVPNHIYLCDVFLFESAFKLWNGKFFYHPHFIICESLYLYCTLITFQMQSKWKEIIMNWPYILSNIFRWRKLKYDEHFIIKDWQNS